MKIGILGAGKIAHVLAKTMVQMEEVELYAVASRSIEKAEEFAKQYDITKAYGGYEELVTDAQVELVYIATPHSHHYAHMKLCIEHKKPVLCEKAFTMNATQAKEIRTLARKHNVFVTEAIWTRYMPSRQMINEVLASGVVGKISMATANLSYNIQAVERIIQPALAGGALLDVGVYGINFLLMHMGDEIDHIESSVQMTDTGVDGRESITIFFKDNKVGVTTHGIYGRSDRKGIFYGEKGYVIVENINNPQCIKVYDDSDSLLEQIEVPTQISGYEYQIRECIRAISEGKTESASMPLDDSVAVMEIMDNLRKQWGLVYPGEYNQTLES